MAPHRGVKPLLRILHPPVHPFRRRSNMVEDLFDIFACPKVLADISDLHLLH